MSSQEIKRIDWGEYFAEGNKIMAKIKSLMADPHPGLSTWVVAMQNAMDEFKAWWYEDM